MQQLTAAGEPAFYFVGVTTGQSSIMKVFPKWADALGIKAIIKGIDLPLHAPPEDYRKVVDFMKNDPLSLGALVTTHKLDLYKACRDMFDYADPYAQKLAEVSSLSKKGKTFCAFAKDPISSGLALEEFVPRGFWTDHGGEVLLLGAGAVPWRCPCIFRGKKPGRTGPAVSPSRTAARAGWNRQKLPSRAAKRK